MSARLKDKVALVTGAASGIGAATARLFAAHGAQVFGLDRNPSPERGDKPVHLIADVTDAESIGVAVARILGQHGRIDVLVSNAGSEGRA